MECQDYCVDCGGVVGVEVDCPGGEHTLVTVAAGLVPPGPNRSPLAELARLQEVIDDLVALVVAEARFGLSLGAAPEDHEPDGCADCACYEDARTWWSRLHSGELGELGRGAAGELAEEFPDDVPDTQR